MSQSNNQVINCCVCYNLISTNNNFSAWQCIGKHSEKLCNSCLSELMKININTKCPMCRAPSFSNWGIRIANANRIKIFKKKFGSKYVLIMKKCFDNNDLIKERLSGKYICDDIFLMNIQKNKYTSKIWKKYLNIDLNRLNNDMYFKYFKTIEGEVKIKISVKLKKCPDNKHLIKKQLRGMYRCDKPYKIYDVFGYNVGLLEYLSQHEQKYLNINSKCLNNAMYVTECFKTFKGEVVINILVTLNLIKTMTQNILEKDKKKVNNIKYPKLVKKKWGISKACNSRQFRHKFF